MLFISFQKRLATCLVVFWSEAIYSFPESDRISAFLFSSAGNVAANMSSSLMTRQSVANPLMIILIFFSYATCIENIICTITGIEAYK